MTFIEFLREASETEIVLELARMMNAATEATRFLSSLGHTLKEEDMFIIHLLTIQDKLHSEVDREILKDPEMLKSLPQAQALRRKRRENPDPDVEKKKEALKTLLGMEEKGEA